MNLLRQKHPDFSEYVDRVFGSYCVMMILVGLYNWWNEKQGIQSFVIIFLFTIINAAITQISVRNDDAGKVEIIRAIVGGVIAPVSFLLVEPPFFPWWQGFLIMYLGGTILLGILLRSRIIGRILLIYYSFILALCEFWKNPAVNWYELLNYVGTMALTGLVFLEIVLLLGELLQSEEEAKIKSDSLLLNILPKEIMEELKEQGFVKPRKIESATVMFIDFEGFTKIAEQIPAEELIDELDICFSYFDKIVYEHGLEKLKTIGDAYLCVGGLPGSKKEHTKNCLLAALEIQQFLFNRKLEMENHDKVYWNFRIGIHTGTIIAGIIGKKKFAYDIWGDTVNTASRIESNGVAGQVNISKEAYDLAGKEFHCEYKGKVHAKNKGEIDLFIVKGKMLDHT